METRRHTHAKAQAFQQNVAIRLMNTEAISLDIFTLHVQMSVSTSASHIRPIFRLPRHNLSVGTLDNSTGAQGE